MSGIYARVKADTSARKPLPVANQGEEEKKKPTGIYAKVASKQSQQQSSSVLPAGFGLDESMFRTANSTPALRDPNAPTIKDLAASAGQGIARAWATTGASIASYLESNRGPSLYETVKAAREGRVLPEQPKQKVKVGEAPVNPKTFFGEGLFAEALGETVFGRSEPFTAKSEDIEFLTAFGADEKAAAGTGGSLTLLLSALDLSGLGGAPKGLAGAVNAVRGAKNVKGAVEVGRAIGLSENVAQQYAGTFLKATTAEEAKAALELASKAQVAETPKGGTGKLYEKIAASTGKKPADGTIDISDPVDEVKVELPKTSEEAADRYYTEALAPKLEKGENVVVSADDMKYHFGNDFDKTRHPIYSQATGANLLRVAKEHPGEDVIFTAGGPGSGKTEVIRNVIEPNINGVIYDSNLSNLEGALKQIDALEEAGKNVEVMGVLRDPESAYRFTKQREAVGGHPVSDAAFIRNHAGTPEVLLGLMDKGKKVNVIDVRGINSIEGLKNLRVVRTSDEVRQLLTSTKRTEDDIMAITKAYGNSNTTTGARVAEGNADSVGDVRPLAGTKDRTLHGHGEAGGHKGRKDTDGSGGTRVLQGGDEVGGRKEKAAEDWEKNYADDAVRISDSISEVREKLKGAKKAERPALEAELARLNKEGAAIENEFLKKWGDEGTAGDAPKPEESKPAPKPAAKERKNKKLEERAREAASFDDFYQKSGITREALDATARSKGYADAADFYDKNKTPFSETDSFELAAKGDRESEFALQRSAKEEERFLFDVRSTFASLKGIEVERLDYKFTDETLEGLAEEYSYMSDFLTDHPGRALMKFRSRKEGEFLDYKDPRKAKTPLERERITERNQKVSDAISKAVDDMHGWETREAADNSDWAREKIDDYIKLRDQVKEIHENLKNVRRTILLQKQFGEFTQSAKRVAAREVAKDMKALRNLVEAAERSGFRRGIEQGSGKFKELVSRLKSRRTEITAVKKRYNLTDAQMRVIRGNADPRFMSKTEFEDYMKDIETKAAEQHAKNEERIIIDAIIQERELKKSENLQRALEFPTPKDMSLEQLREFSDILAKTEAGDTFLGPRMIQTAKNTDLGSIRTMQEGIAAITKQSGLPYNGPVHGSKVDRWLRDPTLVEKDPLHRLFISEWVAKEGDMLTRKAALNQELTKLAKAARIARKKADKTARARGAIKQSIKERVFSKLAPADRLVVQWLQPFITRYTDDGKKIVEKVPELRSRAEAAMTVQELRYARFLESFFKKYYDVAQQEAMIRWTLLGVKKSNYKDMYFAHLPRTFLERWRDDGFTKAIKILWDQEVADVKIDFNAFGDRGEVLGYEKWLNRGMTRRGEGVNKLTGEVFYTQNATKVAMAYFHAFERKMILDGMIPKIKLLEYLMGARYKGPKSIANPEGAEQVHSQLRRHINEWINNKKGQRIEMVYEQGDRVEKIVDGLRLFIAIKHLGGNAIAQIISGFGGSAATLAGLGFRGWGRGAKRALSSQGRKLGRAHAGVIGETPWSELASASNDAADTLRGGLFYIFGEMAYRSRRQFFLGSLTKEEFKTGVITPKRLAEIKLEMGKFHALPEFRSIAGNTSFVKTAGMYTEWAVPILQNTYFTQIPRIMRMAKSGDWKALAKSKEFKQLSRSIITGAGLGAAAYLILQPDENDKSLLGYARNKAAQEISTIMGVMTLSGIPLPGSVFINYLDQLRNAIQMLITLERYEASGDGYEKGDLRGLNALRRALVPRGIEQVGEAAGAVVPEKKSAFPVLPTVGGSSGKGGLPEMPELPELPDLPALPSL